jgi:hypothetical protein
MQTVIYVAVFGLLFCLGSIAMSLYQLEKIMSTVSAPGLAALQAFQTSFQTFVTQQSADLATLTTTIQAAITALGNSEDPAVQQVATSLTSALSTVQANETALEALNASLGTAENPSTPAGAVAQAAKKA